jgi:hypothetical protein
MEVLVKINNCRHCHHISHSGAYTPGGAKTICAHPEVNQIIGCWDWQKRVIEDSWIKNNEIPVFCPMLNGKNY